MHRKKRFGKKQLCSVMLAVSLIAGSVMPAFATEAGLPEAEGIETSIGDGQAGADLSSDEDAAAAAINGESSENESPAETGTDKEQDQGESGQTDSAQVPDMSAGQDPAAENNDPDTAETGAVNTDGAADGTEGAARNEVGTEGTEGTTDVPEGAERGTLYFISEPDDVSAFAGHTVNLHVEVNESGAAYQWQWSPNGTSWVNCTSSGSNTDTFTFIMREALAGRYYRCVASLEGETVESEAALITLAEPTLEFTVQPDDMSAFEGNTVTLHAEASDSGAAYQWQWSPNGTSWVNCTSSGSNTDTFTFIMRAALAGRYYRCVASTADEAVESEAAQITLAEATLAFTEQPDDVSAFEGNTVTLHAEVNESGADYQWQWSPNGTSWVNCTSSGSNTDTFTFIMRAALAGRYYRCVASLADETVASEAAQVTLAEPTLAFTEQPDDVSAFEGNTVTLHAVASDSGADYQWQWSLNGTAWVNCTSSGSDTDTFTFIMRAALAGRYYRCVASLADETVASEAVQVTLAEPTLEFTDQPDDVSAFEGNTVTLHAEASDSGADYQWQWSLNGTAWVNCTSSGSDTDTFTFIMRAALAGRYYRCVASTADETVASEAAQVTLAEPTLEFTDQPDDVSAFEGNTVTLHAEASDSGADYQWQWSLNGTAWVNCTSSGSDTNTFTFVMREALAGRYYRCVASLEGETVESEAAQVTLAEHELAFRFQPQDVNAEDGETVSLHVEVNENDVSYQWQWSLNGTAWVNCTSPGYDTDTFTFIMREALSGRYYRCEVRSANETIASNAALISLAGQELSITLRPENLDVHLGDSVTLYAEASESDVYYQWQWSQDGTSWTWLTNPVYQRNTFSFTVRGTWLECYYRCYAITPDSSVMVVSNTAKITKKPLTPSTITITRQPQDVTVMYGNDTTLQVEAVSTNSDAELSYVWEVSYDGGNTWNSRMWSQECEINYVNTDGYKYRCLIMSGNDFVYSNIATISLSKTPVIISEPSDINVTPDTVDSWGDFYFNIDVYGEDLEYQWQVSTDDGSTWNDCEGENENIIYIEDPEAAAGNLYRCIAANSYGTVISDAARMDYYEGFYISTHPQDVTAIIGEEATFQIEVVEENPDAEIQYSWMYQEYDEENDEYYTVSINDNESVWTDTLTLTATPELNGKYFACEVNHDLYGCIVSNPAKLTVISNLEIETQPKDFYILPGDTTWPVFWISANGVNVTYQWQVSEDGGETWTDCINGITYDEESVGLIIYDPVSAEGNLYHCIVSDGLQTLISDSVEIVNYSGFYFISQPEDQNAEVGQEITFSVEAIDEDPNAEITYQWYYGADEESLSPIEGANGTTLTITAMPENHCHYYACKAETYHGTITTNLAMLRVDPPEIPIIYQQPEDVEIKTGQIAEFVVGDYSVESLYYDWQMSSDNGATWSQCSVRNDYSSPYISGNYLLIADPEDWNGYLFRCIVSNSYGSVTSDAARLTIYYDGVTITQQPEDVVSEPGQGFQFSIAATDDDPEAELTYQWYSSPRYLEDDLRHIYDWEPVYGATGTTLSIDSDDVAIYNGNSCIYNGMYYKCEVTSSVHGVAYSEPASYWFAPVSANTLQITRHPTGVELVAGTSEGVSATFAVIAEGDADAGEIRYQWEYSNDYGNTWTTLEGKTSSILIVSEQEEWAWRSYRCVVSNDVDVLTSHVAKMLPIYIY